MKEKRKLRKETYSKHLSGKVVGALRTIPRPCASKQPVPDHLSGRGAGAPHLWLERRLCTSLSLRLAFRGAARGWPRDGLIFRGQSRTDRNHLCPAPSPRLALLRPRPWGWIQATTRTLWAGWGAPHHQAPGRLVGMSSRELQSGGPAILQLMPWSRRGDVSPSSGPTHSSPVEVL